MTLPTFTATAHISAIEGAHDVALPAGARVVFTSNVPANGSITFDGNIYRINDAVATFDADGYLTANGGAVELLAQDAGLNFENLQWRVSVVDAIDMPLIQPWWIDAPAAGQTVDLATVAAAPNGAVAPTGTPGRKGDKGDTGPAGPALRPLSAFYRPLQGVTGDITSALTNDLSGSDTLIPWNANTGKYRFSGLVPEQNGGDPNSCLNDNNGLAQAPTYHQQPIVVEFWSNATTVRVWGGTGGNLDVWAIVDDQRITQGFQHTAFAGVMTWTLTQSSAVWRKWRLCIAPIMFSIQVNSGAAIVETTPGFQLAIVGDSFIEGGFTSAAGAIGPGAPAGEFEQITGLDVWRLGVGGTGYVSDGGLGSAGPYAAPGRIAKLAAMPDMDAVVVFGGGNDGEADEATLVAAANATWTAVKAAQPTAPLIVVGIQCGLPNSTLDALNAALKTAAEAHADVLAFVDLRGDSFITGTGNVGAPVGDGNADVFINADSSHPSDVGSRWWGENLARLLGAVLI